MNSYFVVYDIEDNIVCYLDNIYDFNSFTGIRIKDIMYRFKKTKSHFISIKRDNQTLKIYKFLK